MVTMTHQNLSLEKCWKLFWATLKGKIMWIGAFATVLSVWSWTSVRERLNLLVIEIKQCSWIWNILRSSLIQPSADSIVPSLKSMIKQRALWWKTQCTLFCLLKPKFGWHCMQWLKRPFHEDKQRSAVHHHK